MAVPKGKQSKSRTNKRFANYKATAPTLVECPLSFDEAAPQGLRKMRLLRQG
jgi:hypothetical protein